MIEMAILSPEQLTGRERTHVRELPELACTLHPQAAQAFMALRARARLSGIDLAVASSFRDFEQQRAIWNAKFRGQRPLLDRNGRPLDVKLMSAPQIVEAILLWSALPGASRHHWGTEIDVFDRAALLPGQRPQLLSAEYGADGPFAKLAAWLAVYAHSYSFFLPYDLDRGGVQPEPWHLSYAPVSSTALMALTPQVLHEALRGADVAGIEVVVDQLSDIHRRYVCGVAQPAA
jgi:LAS superfamily LD-carboxypeptidase LdcB